jgi:hypothetical protein
MREKSGVAMMNAPVSWMSHLQYVPAHWARCMIRRHAPVLIDAFAFLDAGYAGVQSACLVGSCLCSDGCTLSRHIPVSGGVARGACSDLRTAHSGDHLKAQKPAPPTAVSRILHQEQRIAETANEGEQAHAVNVNAAHRRGTGAFYGHTRHRNRRVASCRLLRAPAG